MLGHARLTQPELADKLSDRAGALAQQVEDAATRRLSHDCERRHGHHHTYQVIYLSRHVDHVTVLWRASRQPSRFRTLGALAYGGPPLGASIESRISMPWCVNPRIDPRRSRLYL